MNLQLGFKESTFQRAAVESSGGPLELKTEDLYSSLSYYLLINNLRYADDTTLMAESEEELKSLLM